MDHLRIDCYCKYVNASLTDKSGLMWMRHSKEFLPLLNILATLVHKQTLSISPSGLQLSEPWAQSFPPVRILAACAMVSTDSCTRSEAAVQGDLWDQAAESLPGGILSGSSPSLVLAWIMLLFCSLAMLLPQPDPRSRFAGCLWSITSLKTCLASTGLSSDPV